MLLGDAFQRQKFVDTCVVDQNIESAECFLRLREEALDLRLFCYVGLHSNGLSTVACNLVDHAVGPLFAGGVVDDHGGALGCQMLGNSGADSLGCSRHHCNFICKFLRHEISPVRICTEH